MREPYLQHFTESEFVNENGNWWFMMSSRLLVMLDVLRFSHGRPIVISPNKFALGRRAGGSESEHNIDFWKEVCAADVFVSEVYTRRQAESLIETAKSIGFTGIGVYTDTHNHKGTKQVMFHLGVRNTEKMGDPATWGRIKGDYVSMSQALGALK